VSARVRCPNDDGHKVTVERKEAITKTVTAPVPLRSALIWGLLFVAAGVPAAVVVSVAFDALMLVLVVDVLGISLPADLEGSSLPFASYSPLLLVLALLVVVARVVVRTTRGQLRRTRVERLGTLYHCRCQSCGHRWVWDDRMPEPLPQIRTGLATGRTPES